MMYVFYGLALFSLVLFVGILILPHFTNIPALSSGSILYALVVLEFVLSTTLIIIGIRLLLTRRSVHRGAGVYIGCAMAMAVLVALVYSMAILGRVH